MENIAIDGENKDKEYIKIPTYLFSKSITKTIKDKNGNEKILTLSIDAKIVYALLQGKNEVFFTSKKGVVYYFCDRDFLTNAVGIAKLRLGKIFHDLKEMDMIYVSFIELGEESFYVYTKKE